MSAAHTAVAVRVTSIAPNSREQAIVDLSISSKETSLHPGPFRFRLQDRYPNAVDTLQGARQDWRNVTELRNHQYVYRLRVGRYRVLFNYEATVEIVTIEEVKKRDERTH